MAHLATADRVAREIQARANTVALAANHTTPDVTSAVQTNVSMGPEDVAVDQELSGDQRKMGGVRNLSFAEFSGSISHSWLPDLDIIKYSSTPRPATPLEDTPISMANNEYEEGIELEEPANAPGAWADDPPLQPEDDNPMKVMVYLDRLFAPLEI